MADRFHLVKNVGEVAERVLKRHTLALQCIAVPARAAGRSVGTLPTQATLAPPRRYREAARTRTQAQRVERYEAIHALVRQGMTRRAIARVLGCNRKTIQAYLAANGVPQKPPQVRKASILRPYEPYLLER